MITQLRSTTLHYFVELCPKLLQGHEFLQRSIDLFTWSWYLLLWDSLQTVAWTSDQSLVQPAVLWLERNAGSQEFWINLTSPLSNSFLSAFATLWEIHTCESPQLPKRTLHYEKRTTYWSHVGWVRLRAEAEKVQICGMDLKTSKTVLTR